MLVGVRDEESSRADSSVQIPRSSFEGWKVLVRDVWVKK